MANEALRGGTSTHASGWWKAALFLAIIGALNWGLIGFFNWNLVDAILGGDPREMTSVASRVVYALVGVAGLIGLFKVPRLIDPGNGRHGAAPLPSTR